jgi:hypothetical protein
MPIQACRTYIDPTLLAQHHNQEISETDCAGNFVGSLTGFFFSGSTCISTGSGGSGSARKALSRSACQSISKSGSKSSGASHRGRFLFFEDFFRVVEGFSDSSSNDQARSQGGGVRLTCLGLSSLQGVGLGERREDLLDSPGLDSGVEGGEYWRLRSEDSGPFRVDSVGRRRAFEVL